MLVGGLERVPVGRVGWLAVDLLVLLQAALLFYCLVYWVQDGVLVLAVLLLAGSVGAVGGQFTVGD